MLFALILSLRLLGSAGYMPMLDRGSLTLIACPDAELNAPLAPSAMQHHGRMQHHHSICPYAAAAALGATEEAFVPLLATRIVGMAPLLGKAFAFIERQNGHERPPAIGPRFARSADSP